jgi:Tol biopolymer transport system component
MLLMQSVAAPAAAIPTVSLSYKEIKLTDHGGGLFALGFMPSYPGILYWGTYDGGSGHLYTYDPSKQIAKEMLRVIPGNVVPIGFTWSPDGRQAAISEGQVLKLLDINTHAANNLFMGGQVQSGAMFWTPNHTIIASCTPAAHAVRLLCVIDTVRGLVTVLTAPNGDSAEPAGYIEGANKLIVAQWVPEKGPLPQVYLASIYPDRLGNLVPLSYPGISSDGNLTVTPDGEYGAVIGKPAAKDPTLDVYLGDLSSGHWVRVPSPADWGKPSRAMLSPDHKHLVVASLDDKGGYRLWMADVPDKLLGAQDASN